MSNLTTSHDILADALFRAGEIADPTSSITNSDYYNQSIIYLNRHYQSICAGGSEVDPEFDEDWWWLQATSPGTITLQPSYNTGTVALTNNGLIGTFSNPPSFSTLGYFFKATNDAGDWFRIISHTAGNATFLLDSVYTDVTTAAIAFRAMKMIYTLPADCKAVQDGMRVFQQEMFEITENENMRQDFPLHRMSPGIPKSYRMVTESSVEFDRYISDTAGQLCRVEFDYKVLPTALADDTNTPIIPLQFRHILSDLVAYQILVDKNDDRVSLLLSTAKSSLQAMSNEHHRRMNDQGAGTFGQIVPRLGKSSKFDGPIRTQSGMILG